MNTPNAVTNTLGIPNSDSGRSSIWLCMLLAAIGAFFACVIDIAVNSENANCNKFGTAVAKIIPTANYKMESVGVMFVVLVSGVIVMASDIKNKWHALVLGMMIFSTIATIFPIKDVKFDTKPLDSIRGGASQSSNHSSWHIHAPAQERAYLEASIFTLSSSDYSTLHPFVASNDTLEFTPNAQVVGNNALPVSECKPSYWGVFGLGSLLDSSLRWCHTYHVLVPGQQVEILGYWKTWPSGFPYAKIRYKQDESTYTGWTYAGNKDKEYFWTTIIPFDRDKQWPEIDS